MTDDCRRIYLEEIGAHLRRCRVEAGLSQRTAAYRAGVCQEYWCKAEKGAYDFRIGTLERMIRATDVEAKEFWKGILLTTGPLEGSSEGETI